MMKKILSMAAVLLLVSACESTPSDDSMSGMNGNGMNGTAAAGSARDFAENVGDRVFYATDSSTLTSEARMTLDKQVAWLKRYNTTKVTVEGHADERGTREFNLALGERRATAAKNYLVGAGIAASRVSTISYGKERPAVQGDNEAAWAQNRRAVTVVTQ